MNLQARRIFASSSLPLLLLVSGCSAGGAGAPPTGGNPLQGTGNQQGTGLVPGSGGDTGAGGTVDTSAGGTPAVGSGGTSAAVTTQGGTVTFDWPEGAAATAGVCLAGHYSGTFSGLYASGLTFVGVPIPVAGNLSLTLAQSADGEFYKITGGKICGDADGAFPFQADVTGTLDCKTGQLVNGRLENGGYWLGINVAGIPPAGTFEGPFPATYDKTAHKFTGTWKVYEPKEANPEPIFGGNGPWDATFGAATSDSQLGCVGGVDAGAP